MVERRERTINEWIARHPPTETPPRRPPNEGSEDCRIPPLESRSSDEGWSQLAPDSPAEAGPSSASSRGRPHTRSTSRTSSRQDPMPGPSSSAPVRGDRDRARNHSSGGHRDEWRSVGSRGSGGRPPLHPSAPAAPQRSSGRYSGLGDEVPEADVLWDLEGDGGDPMEDFGITPPRGTRRPRRHDWDADAEEYMDSVRRGFLGDAYVPSEPRHSSEDMDDMDVRAVGARGGRRWEPRARTWEPRRPAFLVLKAADAAAWEGLKDICPPHYDGNPLNLDRFLEKLDDWGMFVTEDMDPDRAEAYVYKRFRYRLPEVLGEMLFDAMKNSKAKNLKEEWLKEQEEGGAPRSPRGDGKR